MRNARDRELNDDIRNPAAYHALPAPRRCRAVWLPPRYVHVRAHAWASCCGCVRAVPGERSHGAKHAINGGDARVGSVGAR